MNGNPGPVWLAIRRAERICSRVLLTLSGAALLVLMALAGGNVLLRLLGKPSGAVYELAGFCGALVVSFALVEAQRRGAHVAVDIVYRRYPAKLRSWIRAGNSLLFGVFFVIMAWQVFCRGRIVRDAGEVSETLKLHFHPFMYCVSLGFAVLAFALFLDCVDVVRWGVGRDERVAG